MQANAGVFVQLGEGPSVSFPDVEVPELPVAPDVEDILEAAVVGSVSPVSGSSPNSDELVHV